MYINLVPTLSLALVWLQSTRGQDQCYFPDGQVAEGHSPCSDSSSSTFCCPFGYTCFSNHICIATDPGTGAPFQQAARGSCTDDTWDTGACGDFCLGRVRPGRGGSEEADSHVADDPYNDNTGSVLACGNDEWCCQVDVEDGRCNCYEGVGMFSLAPGEARTIIGIQGLEFTATDFLPSSSPPSVQSPTDGASSRQRYSETPTTATTSPSQSRTVPATSAVSSSSSLSSSPSTTNTRFTSSTHHDSSLPTTSQQVETSSSAGSTSNTPSLAAPLSSSTAYASPSSSTTSSTSQPSYAATHKTGIGAGTGVAVAVIILAVLAGIWCCRRKSRDNEPIKPQPYRELVNPSHIIGPTNSEFIDVPPVPHPYGQSTILQAQAEYARVSSPGRLDPAPNPHPYQRPNNNSPGPTNPSTSRSDVLGNPSAGYSNTQQSVSMLDTRNPRLSRGSLNDPPFPHPYSPRGQQAAPLIPLDTSRDVAAGAPDNRPYHLFHNAAGSLAQDPGTGTPPPRYSPQHPAGAAHAWSPQDVGSGDGRRLL